MNNEPAFPHSNGDKCFGTTGMTLRDYFAAKAMQGFAADPEMTCTESDIAKAAYRWADAMLEARMTRF